MKARLFTYFFRTINYINGNRDINNNQELTLKDNDEIVRIYKISSSKFGEGSEEDSYKTPLGKHEIKKMIGEGMRLEEGLSAECIQEKYFLFIQIEKICRGRCCAKQNTMAIWP